MAFDSWACRLIRRKWDEERKTCYILPCGDTLAAQITEDRANVRLITRVNVAFFTPQELRRYRRRQQALASRAVHPPQGAG